MNDSAVLDFDQLNTWLLQDFYEDELAAVFSSQHRAILSSLEAAVVDPEAGQHDDGKSKEEEDKNCETHKRKRPVRQQNKLSERARKQKFTEKVNILKQLIPNCNKKYTSFILDDAISYITKLQYQFQRMVAARQYYSMYSSWMMMHQPRQHNIQFPSFPPFQNAHHLGCGMGMNMAVSLPTKSATGDEKGPPK